MKVARNNDKPPTILVENPLCGNSSFGVATRMKRVEGLRRHATGQECRKIWEHEEECPWRDCHKVVLVADPVERFLSALALFTLPDAEALLEEDVDLAFLEHVRTEHLDNYNAFSYSEAVLDAVDRVDCWGELPNALRGQTQWLDVAYDSVIARNDLALWGNTTGVFVPRANPIYSRFVHGRPPIAIMERVKADIYETYFEDAELFERLRLWSPDSEQCRFLLGPDRSCHPSTVRRSPDGRRIETLQTKDLPHGQESQDSAIFEEKTPPNEKE